MFSPEEIGSAAPPATLVASTRSAKEGMFAQASTRTIDYNRM